MKSYFASADIGIIGLLFFFSLFLGVLAWVMWPGSKEKFKKHGEIPLNDDREG